VGALDNLVRIGQLKAEAPSRAEFEGLVRSGSARLRDAENVGLSLYGRFDLAYNAAHALALAALRARGYRSENRYLVFQCLEHTLELPKEQCRVLDQAHRKRNVAEYTGDAEVGALIVRTGTGTITGGAINARSQLQVSTSFRTSRGATNTTAFTLTFDPVYNRPSALATIAGNYRDPDTNAVINVNANGVISRFANSSSSRCRASSSSSSTTAVTHGCSAASTRARASSRSTPCHAPALAASAARRWIARPRRGRTSTSSRPPARARSRARRSAAPR
jgi:hypothetical protein